MNMFLSKAGASISYEQMLLLDSTDCDLLVGFPQIQPEFETNQEVYNALHSS